MEQGLLNEHSWGKKKEHGGGSESDSYACKAAFRETDAAKLAERWRKIYRVRPNVQSETNRISRQVSIETISSKLCIIQTYSIYIQCV